MREVIGGRKRFPNLALVLLSLGILALGVPASAPGDPSILEPAIGATIPYGQTDMYGQAVVFKIAQESGVTCDSYRLELDGKETGSGTFGGSGGTCTHSYRPGVGSHTWRAWRFHNGLDPSNEPGETKHYSALGTFTVLSPEASPPSAANPRVTSVSPPDGATVTSPRPAFSISAEGIDSNRSIFVRVSDTWQVSGPELAHPLLLGGLLEARATASGSTTWTATEYADLSPGTYYWQWDFIAGPCPAAGCAGPVSRFTIQAPQTTPVPTPAPPDTGTYDAISPTVKPLSATGTPGRKMRLLFRVNDDRGRVALTLRLYKVSSVILSRRFPMQQVKGGMTYYIEWAVPRSASGKYNLCLNARDPAGNESGQRCSTIRVR